MPTLITDNKKRGEYQIQKIKKYLITLVMFVCLLTQTGCWDRKEYDEIGFILQFGLEMDQKEQLLFSMTSPVVSPEVKDKVEFLHISSEKLIRASRERLRNIAGKQLEGGKIQHSFFSKDLAEKGINQFFEFLLRDPENPLLANIIVVDGSPKEMLEFSLEFKDKPRSAFYINELLLDARQRSVAPETRVYNFSILSYSKTIDPVTPIIKYNEKYVEVAGSALFSGDKMVGEIDVDQSMLLNTLISNNKRFEYIYRGQAPGQSSEIIKAGTAISVKSSKRKIKIDARSGVPVIHVKLELEAGLDEYVGDYNLDENENKKMLEEIIAKALQAEIELLLSYLQNVGADPIGFGEMVRAKRIMKVADWKDVYKDAVIQVEVNLNIQSYGVTN